MPLGKLSKKQIRSAYKILTEVQEMIKADSGTPTKFLDASNRFFTLIPHDFGMKSPPLLDNPDFIRWGTQNWRFYWNLSKVNVKTLFS